MWRDCDFWCAEDRTLDQVLPTGRGVISFASCESGLPNCIEVAVLVARDRFMSRVEKVAAPCENGDDNGGGCEDGSLGGDDWKGEGERWSRRW